MNERIINRAATSIISICKPCEQRACTFKKSVNDTVELFSSTPAQMGRAISYLDTKVDLPPQCEGKSDISSQVKVINLQLSKS